MKDKNNLAIFVMFRSYGEVIGVSLMEIYFYRHTLAWETRSAY